LEAIVYRAAVPILTLLQDHAPEAVAALTPSVVRIMLAAVRERGRITFKAFAEGHYLPHAKVHKRSWRTDESGTAWLAARFGTRRLDEDHRPGRRRYAARATPRSRARNLEPLPRSPLCNLQASPPRWPCNGESSEGDKQAEGARGPHRVSPSRR